MPTYEYVCKECGEHLEAVQSFTDPALTTCDACGGPLRKVFGNVGIVFKGSGFYKTDSRSASSAPGSKGGEAAPAKAESTTATTSPTTAAPATPAAPASTSSAPAPAAASSATGS